MKLAGKLVKGTKIIREAAVEKNDEGLSFRDMLEQCLIELCRDLDIQVPLWLDKNTTEFGRFRVTFFSREQFLERVSFDKFEIRLV